MAEVVTTRVWEGLEVFQFTDTETGQVEIYKADVNTNSPKGDLLARTVSTGSGPNIKNEWKFVDKDLFRLAVNNRRRSNNQKSLNDDQFTKAFYLDGANLFNEDRAKGLNNNNAYATTQIATQARSRFFQGNIPGIIDPVTQLQVSSTGKKGTQPVNGQQTSPPGTQPPTGQQGTQTNQQEPVIALESQEQQSNAIVNRSKMRGGSTEILRYPLKPDGPFEYDYIRIRAYDYEPSGIGNNYKVGKNLAGQGYETIILPMQPQISETNGVNWSDDQLNPVQAELGKFAKKAIDGGLFDFKKLGAAAGDLAQAAKNLLADQTTRSAVVAYFAGQAVGANLLGRETGMVINPNLELLFNGPNLRTFNFNFKLTPRSPEESAMCKKIIYAFKRNMATQRSTSKLFLLSPRVFQLEYIYKGGADDKGQKPGEGEGLHPYLNKFKPCAMTNFNVNYTPEGSYATFNQTGSMTQFEINMNFTELMPIYAEDNPADDTKTMGY